MKVPYVVILIIMAFIFGFVLAAVGVEPEVKTVTETKVKEVTPESCRTALDIDNQIFTKIGGALQSYDTQEINRAADFIESVTDRRTRNVRECYSG